MKKIISLIVVLFLVGAGVFAIYSKKVQAPVEINVSDTTVVVDNQAMNKEICFLQETKGELGSDFQFISVNYDKDNKVYGVMNWMPYEKDSLVGNYKGTVEVSNDTLYPKRLNIIYSGEGEGILSLQQEILLLGSNDVVQMSGEKYADKDGVYKYKDITKLEKSYSIPMVDCATVAKNLKTDYLVR